MLVKVVKHPAAPASVSWPGCRRNEPKHSSGHRRHHRPPAALRSLKRSLLMTPMPGHQCGITAPKHPRAQKAGRDATKFCGQKLQQGCPPSTPEVQWLPEDGTSPALQADTGKGGREPPNGNNGGTGTGQRAPQGAQHGHTHRQRQLSAPLPDEREQEHEPPSVW